MLRNSLAREVTAVLVFKILFLTALYFAFFAGPVPSQPHDVFTPVAAEGRHGGAK